MFNWLYRKIAKFVPTPTINNEEVKAIIRAMIAEKIPSQDVILDHIANTAPIPDQEQILGYFAEKCEENMPQETAVLEQLFANGVPEEITLPTKLEIQNYIIDNDYIDLPDTQSIEEAIVEMFDPSTIEVSSKDVLSYLNQQDHTFTVESVTADQILQLIKDKEIDFELPDVETIRQTVTNNLRQIVLQALSQGVAAIQAQEGL